MSVAKRIRERLIEARVLAQKMARVIDANDDPSLKVLYSDLEAVLEELKGGLRFVDSIRADTRLGAEWMNYLTTLSLKLDLIDMATEIEREVQDQKKKEPNADLGKLRLELMGRLTKIVPEYKQTDFTQKLNDQALKQLPENSQLLYNMRELLLKPGATSDENRQELLRRGLKVAMGDMAGDYARLIQERIQSREKQAEELSQKIAAAGPNPKMEAARDMLLEANRADYKRIQEYTDRWGLK